MKQRITRLSVLQTGKILGVLYGFISIVMLPFMLIGMLTNPKGAAPMLFIIVLYPIIGFVGGILMAFLYNSASSWIGGLEISVEAIEGN